MLEVFERAAELLRDGDTIAVVSIVATSGSTPQKSGARMIVDARGASYYTIGGGGLEAAVIEDAVRAIENGKSLIKEYDLTGGSGSTPAMACGGRATVVIDVVYPPLRLVIFGAGHVGRALAECARGLGFSISIVDDREDYLKPEPFGESVDLIQGPSEYEGELPALDQNCYVVICTRSHVFDLRVLRHAVGSDVAYLGMIGSRLKVKGAFEKLLSEGVSRREMERVHAPIGLDIGSKTPKEIAISILAEIIKTRNQDGRRDKRV